MTPSQRQTMRRQVVAAHRKAASEARSLLAQLEGIVTCAELDHVHWGHVGDLGRINQHLRDAIAPHQSDGATQ